MAQTGLPRILTLSGAIPGEPGVGGVILQDLRNEFPPGTLEFMPAPTQQIVELGWLDRTPELAGHVVRRFETAWRPLNGVIGEAVAWLARKATFTRHCKSLVTQICTTRAAQSCDMVWAILDCPTVIEIAADVARQLNKPLVVLVWDTPELLISHLHMDRWSAASMLCRFRRTIRAAERVGVICEQMQQAFEQQIGPGNYVILRHGIREELWAPPDDGESERLVIGFAGSITAQQPFQKLIHTLDENEWRINNKPVALRLIGSRYTLDSRHPQHIEFFGWQSLPNTVRLLSECHALYLPQPFEPHLRPLAELSFPTKLTTYVAAGRPILLHAPDYASVKPFFEQYPIGLTCSSLSNSDLAQTLRLVDQMDSSTFIGALNGARRREFNSSVFVDRFRQLIGVEATRSMADSKTELASQR